MEDKGQTKEQLIDELEKLRQRITRLEALEDERKRTEEQAKLAYEELNQIFNTAADGMCVIDKDFNMLRVNRTFLTLAGIDKDEAVGKKCYEGLHGPDCHTPNCPLTRIISGEERIQYELEKVRKDGTKIPCIVTATPFRTRSGELIGIVENYKDLTESKWAEEIIKLAYEELNQIFHTAADGMRVIDKDFNMLRVNRTFLTLAGIDKDKAVGKKCYEVFFGPACHTPKCPLSRILSGEKLIVEHELEKVREDGTKIPCIVTAVPFRAPGGEPIGIVEDYRDITKQKKAENHIRSLTQQLLKAQEKERLKIARDLHDRVAQDLSCLKIAYETLFDNQPALPHEIRRKVSELAKMLEGSITAVRDLAYDLRPASLDELGLVRAVFQYCQDFSNKSGVGVDFYSAGIDGLRLDFDTEINLYRLIQEALNNVRKHADADQVIIRLVASLPNIILRIEDDGKGFDVNGRLLSARDERRFGLQSMEERVSLLKGKMRIQSSSVGGTRVFIEIPYKEKNSGSKQNHIDR